MRIRHDTRLGSAVVSVAGWAARTVVSLLGWTWRIRLVAGDDVMEALRAGEGPVVVTFWHNRIVMALPTLRRLHETFLPMALLVSGSRDGELLVRAVRPWRVHVVRGSSTRGGADALWGTVRAIRRLGASPIVVPDGPTGPAYHFKAGVVQLARLSGRPLLAMGFAADRTWQVRSWDRLRVPRPFARVAVALAPLATLPRDLGEGNLEAVRGRQEERLLDVTRQAEAALGLSPDPELSGREAVSPGAAEP